MTSPLDESVQRVISSSVAPAVILEIPSERIVAASPAANQLLTGDQADIVGRNLEEFAADHPTGALDLVIAGRLHGYEAVREIRRDGAAAEPTHVWLRRLGGDTPPRLVLAIFGNATQPACVPPPAGESDEQLTPVLGTTDNALHISRISVDVESLLGYRSTDLIGRSIFALIDPSSAPALLWALAQAASGGAGVTLALSVLPREGDPIALDALVVPLLPATTFAFAFLRASPGADPLVDGAQLREVVWRLGRGSAAVCASREAATPLERDPGILSALSSRELEIVLRLLAGDRVPEIARSLYLAQGTVRNHLSSVFRRLGVSSQQELISLLRGNGSPSQEA